MVTLGTTSGNRYLQRGSNTGRAADQVRQYSVKFVPVPDGTGPAGLPPFSFL